MGRLRYVCFRLRDCSENILYVKYFEMLDSLYVKSDFATSSMNYRND